MNTRKTSIKQIAEETGKTPAYVVKSKYGKMAKDRRIEAVENYDRACSEDFEHWVLHHRKETEKTAKELIDDHEYYYVEPKDLIWLTESEHEQVHKEINKLPWRVKIEEERVKKLSKSQKERWSKIDWTEEMREAKSNERKEWWTEERKRELKMILAKKRENGENLVNVEQLAGKEGYREYQKQYQKIHYQRNKQAWKDYLLQKSYEKRTTEELLKLLEQKKRNFTMPEEKKKRMIDLIMKVLNNREDYITGDKYQKLIDNDSIESIKQQIDQIKDAMDEMNRKIHERGL